MTAAPHHSSACCSMLLLLLLLQLPVLPMCNAQNLDAAAEASVSDFLESLIADSGDGVDANCSTSAEMLTESGDSADELRRRLLLRRAPPLLAARAAAAAAAAASEPRRSCLLVASSRLLPLQPKRYSLHVGCVRAVRRSATEFVGFRATADASVNLLQPSSAELRRCAVRRLLRLPSPDAVAEADADFGRSPSPARRRRSLSSDSSLEAGIRRFVSRRPQLLRSRAASVGRRITRRGFEQLSVSASVQAVEQVSASRYADFADFLLDSIDVADDVRGAIRSGVFDLLPLSGSGEWQEFKMLFRAGRGGRTKFVSLLARRGAGGYDFVVADFRTTFRLAPDLVVVERSSSRMWGAFGSSETVVRRVPAAVTDADVEALMNFFDLAAFKRFAELLQMPTRRRQRRSVAGAFAAVNAGIDTYSKFAKAFATKKTSRIVGKIVGKGFNYFAMRSRAHIISRLQPQHLDWYLSRLHRLYGLPSTPDVQDAIQIIRFAGFQEWNKNDFLFEAKSGGRNAWVTILANKNSDGSYNFLIANVEQKFKLAPNVLIIKQSKSVAGGIYQSEKYKFKKMPRSITEEDLQMLMNFFNIVTFKRFGQRFKVDTSKLDG